MKQIDVILQLKSLKSIQPDSNVLKTIEKNVYSHLKTDDRNFVWKQIKSFSSNIFLILKILKTNPFTTYSIGVAFLIVVFLSVYTGFLPNEISKTLLYTKIAVAPNQYIKASIALSSAQTKIDSINYTSNKLHKNEIKDISQSIALANQELSALKLMGEKGKYTQSECQELYRSYHTSLENLDHHITASSSNEEDKQSIASLKTQISNYEKQAEQKLKLY